MRNWRSSLVLNTGIFLILVAFIIYGFRVSQTVIPVGSTPQQIEQLTRQYGLDRPVIEQYGWFLFTFLPGLTLVGIYGTIGTGNEFQHWFLPKALIILLLFTNTVTILNYLVTAHASVADALGAFWAALVVSALALVNFAFLLVVWNGYRWGVWAFGVNSFVLCTLKFIGHIPVFPVLFEFSAAVILLYFLRSSWSEMD